jgi:histidinol-phosphate aminotransferase
MPTIPVHIAAAAPYQAGKPIDELAREIGMPEDRIVKLASNENPMGMSPKARAAMQAALGDLGRYPDANGFALKAALAARHDVPMDWITLGAGSNDILEMSASVFLEPGKSSVFSQYAFLVYAGATRRTGAQAIIVPAKDYGHDLDAMLAAIRPDTTLVFLANPNNPTGTYLTAADIDAFLAQVPEHVAVVIDEAYDEYLPPEMRQDSIARVRQYPNVILSRTFSKAYGLAGLRVGYAVSRPDVANYLNRIRQAFNVGTAAQAAAIGALADQDFLDETYRLNRAGMATIEAALDALGIAYVRSYGNFILARVGDAAAINAGLLKRGVIVRTVGGYGLPEWLRISIGTEAEISRFLDALTEIVRPSAA